MRKTVLLSLFLWVMATTCFGQSIWDAGHLAHVRDNISSPVYSLAFAQLRKEADALLGMAPPSVVTKETIPPSGDRHDYLSLSRYFWPDPTKPDGLPYINRDGVSNPEIEKLDRPKISTMAGGVTTLSLAWYFSGDEKYAIKAAQLLRTWFLDKETRMNPNLEYAQIVPGLYGGHGRCYGIIDSYSFVEMLDAVQLLEGSASFTVDDSKALREWFGKFLSWLLESEQGKEESLQANNHSTAYDVQVIAYARYVGNREVLEEFLGGFPLRRIHAQIEPDGTQPRELARTLAFGYSEYNLSHMTDVFQIARNCGYTLEGLDLLEKAGEFLGGYLGKDVSEWPYQQISEWDYKQNELCKDLYRLSLLDGERSDFAALSSRYLVRRWSDRFFLLYYEPTCSDEALARTE